MGLFSSDRYSRPGPGVREDEPRKKGLARVWEVFCRDGWSIFRAGLLAILSSIPFIFFVALSITEHVLLYLLIGGLLGGMIAGPQLTGVADTVLRALRDEPGYWWATYKRAWKRNWKASLLPGAVVGLVFALQLFTLYHMDVLGLSASMMVVMLIALLLALGLSIYIWPQIALVDLSFGAVLKNALLMFLGYLPRSGGAVLIQAVYWAPVLLLFPATLVFLFVTGVWLPMFLGIFVVYPPINKAFHVEEEIQKIRDAQMEENGQ
ncbi:MAG: hypothetical protein ACI4OL_09130 [Gemmiger sp.]